jgi:hypothetical protein
MQYHAMRRDRNHGKIETETGQPRRAILAVAWGFVVGILATHFVCFGFPAKALPPSNPERGREMIDPCLGTRWRLEADAAHPGWPARLVLVERSDGRNAIADGQLAIGVEQVAIVGRRSAIPVRQIAIHAGDRIELEQENGPVHARLQALALGSAAAGQALKVRLMQATSGSNFNGPTVAAVALGPGHGRWTASERAVR